MTEYILTFSSTAHSIAAEQAVLAAGIEVRVMPLPAAVGAGCGLCLRIDAGRLPAARQALEQVPIEGIYERSGSIYRRYEEDIHENH